MPISTTTTITARTLQSAVVGRRGRRFLASAPAASASMLEKTTTTTSRQQDRTSRRKSSLLLQQQQKAKQAYYYYDPNRDCHDRRYRNRWLSSPAGAAATATEAAATTTSVAEEPATTTTSAATTKTTDELLAQAGIDRTKLEQLASQRPTPLRLNDMYNYGTATEPTQRLRNAAFLYQELPIRFAQRAYDLITLPHGLSQAPPIQQVAEIYLQHLRKLLQEFPVPDTVEKEEQFTDLLQSFVLDRTSVPVSIAQGVNAWWSSMKVDQDDDDNDTTGETKNTTTRKQDERLQEMDEALYRFFTARVGLRFLTEHYVLSSNRESAKALRNVTSMFPVEQQEQQRGGGIQGDCNIVEEIRRVADLVTHQTKEYYGDDICPKIEIVDCVANSNNDDNNKFTYVPHHLHYMVSELLKNSCRASIRRYKELKAAAAAEKDEQENSNKEKIEIPSIRVILVKGAEDVTIKVADKGGGIPRSLMDKVFMFAHSTASHDEVQAEFGTDDVSGAKIRGFGLPLARIYARYFGGELTLKSTEGYGLDAYLHLPRLGDSCENLPLRVRHSPGATDSLPVSPRSRKQQQQPLSSSSSSSSKGSGALRTFSTHIETRQQPQQQQQQQSYVTTAVAPPAPPLDVDCSDNNRQEQLLAI